MKCGGSPLRTPVAYPWLIRTTQRSFGRLLPLYFPVSGLNDGMSPINSYGGYGVYGLVTQTNRFDAAVALAGSCDLISLYGSLDAWYRYDDSPHERLFQATLLETGQGRMGSPPWKDAGRYLLNSPIFFVDRVQTPLLIIHGDMDYIPIQQGEEFFLSLYRQGKRVAFVRYWGGGARAGEPGQHQGHVAAHPRLVRAGCWSRERLAHDWSAWSNK